MSAEGKGRWEGSQLPLPELTPARAAAQSAVLLGIFFAVIYGGALLAGYARRLENPVLSVSLTGGLMVGLVALFSQRDPNWRTSLAVEYVPITEWLIFGPVGLVACYGVNAARGITYFVASKLLGGHPEQLASSKAQWAGQLGNLPLAWVLPLALAAGLWEELVFRGFLLGRARVIAARFTPDPFKRDAAAVLAVSACFGLGHGYQGVFGLFQTALVGVVLAALVLWRKSLWPAVFAHLAIDSIGLFALHVLKPMLEKLAHGQAPLG